MIRKVIVPLDGSLFGEHALPSALAIARRAEAELQIVHVHPPLAPLYAGGEIVTDLGIDEQLIQRERDYLKDVIARVRKLATVPTKERLLDGPVAEALAAHIEAEKADLVVMSTHGRGPLSRFWLGSVADRLIRESAAPMLLVRPQAVPPDFCSDPAPSRVLVPLDGSALWEQVLDTVAGFSRLMGADLVLLRVVQPAIVSNHAVTEGGVGMYGQKLLAQLRDADERAFQEAGGYLNEVAQRLRAQGLAVQTRVICHEQPSAAILEEARAGRADLIAMATHGRRGIPRLFLGSVADKVLRGTSLPVLVQRPQPVAEAKPIRAETARREEQPAESPEPVASGACGAPGCFHANGL